MKDKFQGLKETPAPKTEPLDNSAEVIEYLQKLTFEEDEDEIADIQQDN